MDCTINWWHSNNRLSRRVFSQQWHNLDGVCRWRGDCCERDSDWLNQRHGIFVSRYGAEQHRSWGVIVGIFGSNANYYDDDFYYFYYFYYYYDYNDYDRADYYYDAAVIWCIKLKFGCNDCADYDYNNNDRSDYYYFNYYKYCDCADNYNYDRA